MLKNLALLTGTVICCLLVAESATRVYFYFTAEQTIYDMQAHVPLPEGHHASLGDLLQLSRISSIIYELRPNLNTTFLGSKLTTNTHGFRGKLISKDKPTEQLRILGIGDSLMFGWGVADGQEYLSLLEAQLNNVQPKKNWQVINTAVPGYNTVVELETLKHKGLSYRPDVVILGFVESNDFKLPYFVRKSPSYLTLRRSFFSEFIDGALDYDDPGQALLHPSRGESQLFARNYGRDFFQEALVELATLSKSYRFKVFIYAHEKVSKKTLVSFSKLELEVIQGWPVIQNYMNKSAIKDYKNSLLTLNAEDPHPSKLGHQLAADIIFQTITLL